MKRILILCDAFGPPSFTPRIRFLCQYLVENGWEVQLCTEKFAPIDFAHSYPIHEIEFYNYSGLLGKLEWVLKSALSLLTDYKNKQFSSKVSKRFQHDSFDIILCSTFHTFPLRAAYDLAHSKHIPLVVDLRDIAEQAPGNQYHAHQSARFSFVANWFRNRNIKRRNAIIQEAQALISVSPWHVDFLRKINPQAHLIYNGFDANLFHPNLVKTDKFIISYTGKLYERSIQDPELFFQALSELASQQSAFTNDCEVRWYTSKEGQNKIQQWAHEHQVDKLMSYHSYISIDEVPNVLHQASIVLVFSNKTQPEGPHGIMTTKFFEALGVEKPVLCVRSDEACLSSAIQETNAGIAGTTIEEVKHFILEKYTEWQANGYTHQPVVKEQKNAFSRQVQAKQFDVLFEQLMAR